MKKRENYFARDKDCCTVRRACSVSSRASFQSGRLIRNTAYLGKSFLALSDTFQSFDRSHVLASPALAKDGAAEVASAIRIRSRQAYRDRMNERTKVRSRL